MRLSSRTWASLRGLWGIGWWINRVDEREIRFSKWKLSIWRNGYKRSLSWGSRCHIHSCRDHISLNELNFKLSFNAKKAFYWFSPPSPFPSSHSRGCAALFLIIHKPRYTEKKRPLLSLQNTMWTTSHKTKTNKIVLWWKKNLSHFRSPSQRRKREEKAEKIIKVRAEIISRKAPLMWKRETLCRSA